MGRKLKCLYCGKEIDTSIDEYQKVNSTRYAHLSCVEKELKKPKPKPKEKPKTQKEIIKEINDFLANHFGDAADYGKTNRLLKTYLKEGMTASGILKTLEYYYDIKKHSIAESGGSIGIVPYVYKDAKDYYQKTWEANKKNEGLELEQETVSVTISNPQFRFPKKQTFFNFLDEEEGEGKSE